MLLLLGWYLIVPPVNEPPSMLDHLDAQRGTMQESTAGKPSILRDAPLSEWEILDSYDSVALCQHERQNLARAASVVKDADAETQSGAFARCIGTDEPRLQEK